MYGLCGFRGGDVWLSINGRALTSPDVALDANVSFREAKTVTFSMQRAGQNLTLTIDLL